MPSKEQGEDLVLECWIHPTMKIPFPLNPKDHPFRVPSSHTVMELMEIVETMVEDVSMKQGQPMEFQIQVLWNVRNHKQALNPADELGKHFASGDKFGIYGDLMPVSASQEEASDKDKLPVTILTGFLGSGKTTLLNYILQEQREKKIAVIENEFGEISIDDALLKKDKLALAEKVVLMDNGCMCCTIRGDLVKGLMQIVDETRKGNKIDAIMIETTGMADPVPIVRTFMTSPEISAELRLDGVVAVADAKHIIGRLDDKVEEGKVNEAYQQVAFADKIILNKIDLTTAEEAITVKDRIREINKYAKVLPAVKGRVKASELTNIRAHDMTNFVNADIEQEAEVAAELVAHGHEEHGGHGGHGGGHGHDENCEEEHGGGGHEGGHGGGHGTGHGSGHGTGHGTGHGNPSKKSRHDTRVNSFAIVREGEIVPRRLSAWMQSLGQLPADKGTIFRIKAILAVKGHPFKHVFHAVMDVSDEDDAGPWAEGEKKVSKIVFIGKSMDEPFLREGFDAIFEQ